jgi:hypothetical protein
MDQDILDSLNKYIILENCIFPMANLNFELSVDIVPASNPLNQLILL